MKIEVNGKCFKVNLEDNITTKKLVEILKEKSISINLEDYGGFEKVGYLGFSLPTSDKYIKTNPGDICLYQGNNIVIFYGHNAWDYTKIGYIENITTLKESLGNKAVKVTFTID